MRPHPRLFDFRGRAIALVLAGAAPALLALGVVTIQAREDAAEASRTEALQVARAIAADQQALIDESRVLLSGIALLPQARESGADCAQILSALRAANVAYANLGVASRDGRVTCSAVQIGPAVSVADRSYFQETLATKRFAVGEFQIGRITGEAAINTGYPILDGETVAGVVFAAIRLTSLDQLIRRAALPEGSVVNVIDRNGTVLARSPESEGIVGRRFKDSRLAAAASRGVEGTIDTKGFDGRQRLYGYTLLPGSARGRVSVVVGVPSGVAFAGAERQRNAALAVLVAVTALAIMAGWLGSRRLVRPVRHLAETARRLEAGDMSARTDLPAGGELGALARTFDEMAVSLERRLAALRYLTHHDELTDLPNRRAIEDAIRGEGPPVGALLLLNLSRFRDVNHTLGPRSGDLLLREAAKRLRTLSDTGLLVARIGGDEFAVLLEDTRRHEAALAAMKLVELFDPPFRLGDLEVDMRVRIGVAPFMRPADPDETIRRAEVAERACRDRSLTCLIYGEELDPYTDQRLRLIGALRGAEERGEMRLVFQPIVDTITGGASRCEALLRWNHPEIGDVPPSIFIPIAEEFGMIRRLTTWVLEEAIRRHKEWAAAGVFLPVSVNVSAASLTDDELPAMIGDLLRREGVSPAALELEITETAAMSHPEIGMAMLADLSGRGIRIAVDDFGTGHSSLAYLSRLPFDTLKIDRSFISALDEDEDAGILVRSTIELAHKLRRRVVAEGVEDSGTRRILEAAGCDFLQGFLLGTPMNSAGLMDWVRAAPPAMVG